MSLFSKSEQPNTVIEGNGFYISLNEVDAEIYGGVTTALVKGQMERLFILNGDHLAAYKDLVPGGFEACYGYFLHHLDQINHLGDQPRQQS